MASTKVTTITLPEPVLTRARAIAKANHWPLRSLLTRLVEAGIERIEREAAISLVLPPPPKFDAPVFVEETKEEPEKLTEVPPVKRLQRPAEPSAAFPNDDEIRDCFRDSEIPSAVQAGILPPE